MLLDVGVCFETVKAWQLIGVFVTILKILAPLLIIITSVVPVFKAVMKGNADETINMGKTILRKIIAAIIIFFIPGLIAASVKIFVGTDYETNDVATCVDCFHNPGGAECQSKIKEYNDLEQKEIKENQTKDKEKEKLPSGEYDDDNVSGSETIEGGN